MKESINFLSPSPPETGSFPIKPKRTRSWLIGFCLGLEALLITLLFYRAKLDGDLARLKAALEPLNRRLIELQPIESKLKQNQRIMENIKRLRGSRSSFAQAAAYLPDLIPEDVKLVSLTLRVEQLNIRAKTPSGLAFAKLIENISRSAKFSNLTLTGSIFDDQENLYTFDFEAQPERVFFR